MTMVCIFCLLLLPIVNLCLYFLPLAGILKELAFVPNYVLLPTIIVCILFALAANPARSETNCKRISKYLLLVKSVWAAYFVGLLIYSFALVCKVHQDLVDSYAFLFLYILCLVNLPVFLTINIACTFVCDKLLRCKFVSYYLPRHCALWQLLPIADLISAVGIHRMVWKMLSNQPNEPVAPTQSE